MILFAHLLLGAAIALWVKNPIFAVILAFLSHYVLDLIPHTEYNIENIKKKQWNKSLPDILKIALDLFSGIFIILLFLSRATLPAGRQAIIFVAAFFAILPDGLTVLGYFLKNKLLELHKNFHREKIHFLKNNPSADSGQRKISNFWRILTQVSIVLIALAALLFSFL